MSKSIQNFMPAGLRYQGMTIISKMLTLAAIAGMVSACSVGPQTTELCTDAAVVSAQSPSSVRDVATRCSGNAGVYAHALAKLNALPSPSTRRITLSPEVPLPNAVRARLEIDVFFYPMEAYPPDVAFGKLDDLVRKINETFRIEAVRIVGSQDGHEKARLGSRLAHDRAVFLRRYLVATGLPAHVPVEVIERDGKHADTLDGRARDRVVEVTVVALRRQALVQ